jgi:hypothetical protein
MKINLVVTELGLIPATDDDKTQLKTLKRGTIVDAKITEYRNYAFLRKYFALINCAWEYLSEEQQRFFYDNKDSFRKTVEVAAGHCEPVYNRTRNEWIDMPKSVAFDKLTESEFSQLYERVKDVLYNLFLTSVNREEFENQLKWF